MDRQIQSMSNVEDGQVETLNSTTSSTTSSTASSIYPVISEYLGDTNTNEELGSFVDLELNNHFMIGHPSAHHHPQLQTDQMERSRHLAGLRRADEDRLKSLMSRASYEAMHRETSLVSNLGQDPELRKAAKKMVEDQLLSAAKMKMDKMMKDAQMKMDKMKDAQTKDTNMEDTNMEDADMKDVEMEDVEMEDAK